MNGILIGFSRSPEVVLRLRAAGHTAWTCDLRPADHPFHILGDVWEVVQRPWRWALFHPHCTYLTVSAAWAFGDGPYHQKVAPGTLVGQARRDARDEAIEDVKRLLALPYPKAIENPARSFLSSAVGKATQAVQPYEFGDDASKLTGLWLDRLPPLQIDPAARCPGRWVMSNGKLVERWANQTDSGQNRLPPSEDRWAVRSNCWPGIATAMAAQWGGLHPA